MPQTETAAGSPLRISKTLRVSASQMPWAERAERFAVFGVKRHGADARSAVPHPHARFVRALAQNGSNLRRERFRAAPQRERVRFVFGKHSGKRRVRLYVIAVYGKDIIAGLNAGFACRAF